MIGHYILEGKEPKKIEDVLEWAKLFEAQNRVLKKTQIGEVEVSTVFLGLDHSYSFNAPCQPILFETMIFGKENDYQKRYHTWDEAMKGHESTCKKVEKELFNL